MRRWLVIIEDDENILGRTATTVEERLLNAIGGEPGLVVVTVVGDEPTMTAHYPSNEQYPKGAVHYGARAIR